MKRFLLVSAFLILFILVAAGTLTLIKHYSTFSTIITDTSCNPPCWHTIQPGQTTMWNAVSILENMQNVYSIMPWEDRYGDKISWNFRYPVKESSGYIYCTDNKVVAISLLTYGSLTVAEALERFGEPDFSWTRYKETIDRRWLEIILVYPTKGIFVRVEIKLPNSTQSVSAIHMDGNNPVGRVIYIDPIQYEYLLSSRILFREDEQTILERLQPWQGLGEVSYEHLVPD